MSCVGVCLLQCIVEYCCSAGLNIPKLTLWMSMILISSQHHNTLQHTLRYPATYTATHLNNILQHDRRRWLSCNKPFSLSSLFSKETHSHGKRSGKEAKKRDCVSTFSNHNQGNYLRQPVCGYTCVCCSV